MNLGIVLTLAIILVIELFLLFALMFSYYYLIKRVAKLFPKYYKKLGSPFLPAADWSILKTIKRDEYNYSLLGKLFRGLPRDFPDDIRLRHLARYVRLELFMIIALIVIGVGLSIGLG